MAQAIRLPFQSYHRLRQWYNKHYQKDMPEGFYQNQLVETFYAGMKHWFHHQPATIRICSYGGDEHYADVHYEMVVGKSSIQIYLMTIVTPQIVLENREIAANFGVQDIDFGTGIKDLENPFDRPNVVWEVDTLGPSDIVDAVRKWSCHFWPDFECRYEYEMLEDGISEELLEGDFGDWKEFTNKVSDSHCKVLLQCDPAIAPEIERWALAKGCDAVYVSQNYMVLLVNYPVEALPLIEEEFPAIDFVVASSLTDKT